MTKHEARKIMIQKRKAMSSRERRCRNEAIAERLFQLECWQQISWFYPYVSYGTEVDTHAMICHALELPAHGGRLRVAVPRVQGREMDFYEITSMEDLEPGYQGIPEPRLSCPRVEAVEGIMLLPGLAFDRNRNRVGYGGGYYDRYLERYSNEKLLTVAVAYDFQIVDVIEAQEHDRKPQMIITERGEIVWNTINHGRD